MSRSKSRTPLRVSARAVAITALAMLAVSSPAARAEREDAPAPSSPRGQWGLRPARSDSVSAVFRNRSRAIWEHALLAPYSVLKLPFTVVGAGLRESIVYLDEHGTIEQVQRLLGPRQGPFGLVLNFSSGGLTGLGGGVTAYHDAFFGPQNRFRLGARTSANGHHRATGGVTIPLGHSNQLELGAGYRVKPNARYFGIGPEALDENESFVRKELTWLGASHRRDIGADFATELGVLFSAAGARGPRNEDTPPLAERFEDDIPPGYHDRSDGLTVSAALVHDSTIETGRPESGGVRSVKVGFFEATDTGRVSFWNYRAEVQQFIPLWHSRRAFALRSFIAWLENTGHDPIPFQRLMTNDDPDLLRGYKDFRWLDQGMVVFTAEYRWPLWNSLTVDGPGLDGYLMADFGQVFRDAEQISIDNMTHSFGGGVRLIGNKGLTGRVEFAASDEESVLRVRADQVFQFAKNGLYWGRNPIPVR